MQSCAPLRSSVSRAPSLRKYAAVLLFVIVLLGLGGVGCQGIYRESEEIHPPDPGSQLVLRMEQARQAQQEADQAAARLRDRAAKGGAARGHLETDVDRLEMAAREFGRRLAAVTDAVAGCDQSNPFAAEIERLRQRCTQMLETVQCIRGEGLSPALPLLDRLLPSPPQP